MAGLVIPAYLVILPIRAFLASVVFLVGRVIPAYRGTRVYLVIAVYLVTRVLAGKRVKQQLQATQGILDRPAGLQLQATQVFLVTRAFLLIQAFQVIQEAGYQVIVV